MSDLGHKQWENATDLPVGEILRRTRTYYNLSLRDVEKNLRIRAIQLEAVEEGRYDVLPGRAYAIGFVRSYGEYLGLDGDKMVNLYKAQAGNNRGRARLNITPAPASESKVPNLYILGASFGVLLVLLVLFAIFNHKSERAGVTIPEVARSEAAPAEMDALMNQMPFEVAMERSIETAVGAADQLIRPQSRIVINALDSAWIEVRDAKGKPLFSRILKQGDKYLIPDQPGITLDTGNVGVLEIVVDGTIIPPLGQPGDVKRKLSLDPDKLLADSGITPAPGGVAPLPVAADAAVEVVPAPPAAVQPVVQAPPVKKAPAPKKPAPEEPTKSRFFFNN